MKRIVRLSANVPEDCYTALREMAARRCTTVTEVLRRAISDEAFIQERLESGARLLVEPREGPIREVVFSK